MQGVQVPAGRELRPHVLVDLARTHAAGVPAADNDRLVDACRCGLVALERHADEVIAQAEGIDDLRGGWQQRHQSHATILHQRRFAARDPRYTRALRGSARRVASSVRRRAHPVRGVGSIPPAAGHLSDDGPRPAGRGHGLMEVRRVCASRACIAGVSAQTGQGPPPRPRDCSESGAVRDRPRVRVRQLAKAGSSRSGQPAVRVWSGPWCWPTLRRCRRT